MARRKRSSRRVVRRAAPRRRRTTTMARRKKRSRSRRTGGKLGMKEAVGAAAYGALRQPLSNLVRNVPVIGALGDEVAMLAATYYLHNKVFKKNGIAKRAARAGFTIEASRLGSSLLSGAFNRLGNSTASSEPQVMRVF